MKIRILCIWIGICLGLTSISGLASWEEKDFPLYSEAVPQYGDTAFQDVLIELDTPPIVDFRFPKIEGFKAIISAMRARLSGLRGNKNILASLNRFLDRAEDDWQKPTESRLRSIGFRRNMHLFRLALNIWMRLRLVNRVDAEFLLRKAEQALNEYEVETAVLEARKILAENHQQLLQDLNDLLWQAGMDSEKENLKIKAEFFSVYNGIAVSVPLQMIDQIRELPNVKNVELDKEVQSAGDLVRPPNISLVGAPAFWDQGITGKYLTIAILDTGVDFKHIDLKNNIWINQAEINLASCVGVPLDYDQDGVITISDLNNIYQEQLIDPRKFNTCVNDFDADGEITGLDLIYRESSTICDGKAGTPSALNPLINCQDEDGNKKIDDLVGWNVFGPSINPVDDHWHGTGVAGIAAANGLYKGVAPDAFILPVKVLGSTAKGSSGSVMAGIDYVVNAPYKPLAQVINMSIAGGPNDSANEALALAADKAVDAGVIVVVAAGNEGGSSFTLTSPGTSRKAITVGASLAKYPDTQDMMLSFSSKGPVYPDLNIKPDISAPGAVCYAKNTARPELPSTCDDPYHVLGTGTSMACPHVAGAAILIKQKYPEFSPEQVKSLLMQTAFDLNLPAHWQGAGRLDLNQTSQAQVLVSPQKIEFGIDPQTSNLWQSQTVTVTLTNLSDYTHSYQLVPEPQTPAGMRYTITPDTAVSIQPGGSSKFQISLSIDNNSVPNADYPGYIHNHINVIADQNLSSPQAQIDTFVFKTCMVNAGCQDCRSNLQIDIYSDTKLYQRISTRNFNNNSPMIPIQCNQMFNVFVTNWPPSSYNENPYFFFKDNLITNSTANALFKKSDAKYRYSIAPSDKTGASFVWNVAYMALTGRLGLKNRIYPAISDYNPGVMFDVSSYGKLNSQYMTMYFTEMSDKYEFSWDLFVQKENTYYQFNDYQGNGIFQNITFQNTPAELRHPRIEFPPLPAGQSYNLAYGYKKYITIQGGTTTSDLLYFTPTKSPSNEPVRLPAISFTDASGVVRSFSMPSVRASRLNTSLATFRTVAEAARVYPLNYLQPSMLATRNEIKLFQTPLIWYGVVAPYIYSNKIFIALTHKNYKQEKNKGVNTIIAPLFSFQTGEAESVKLTANLTDAQGISQNMQVDNLVTYNVINSSQGIPYGPAELDIEYPGYSIDGIQGTAKIYITINPHDGDITPPFIDKFTVTADDEVTGTLYSQATNIIHLKVSDSVPGEESKPDPMVKLYYRVFGSGGNWIELRGDEIDQFIFEQRYDHPVYISLRMIAWDKQGPSEWIPAGNIIDYIVEPAFIYNPEPVCYNTPPLPGGFYFGDINGDGVARLSPEEHSYENLLRRHTVASGCVIPVDDPSLILDLDGNAIIEPCDHNYFNNLFIKFKNSYIPGEVYFVDINNIPELNTYSQKTGMLSVSLKSYIESPRAGFGVEYRILSNPYNCVSLRGRNPHPNPTGLRDQYLWVSQEGQSVFEISNASGISEIGVKVNATCLSGTQVEIEACVPADSEILEYCNCEDPTTWFICYCQSGIVPQGCDCDNPYSWSECGDPTQDPPANCNFDSPYKYQAKQTQRVCAEPIILTIQ